MLSVPVQSDQSPGRPQPLNQRRRVPGQTQRAIDHDFAGLRVKPAQHLLQHHGPVLARWRSAYAAGRLEMV
jgi:hypothetical protein